MVYANEKFYTNYFGKITDNISDKLENTSKQIYSITFNRIVAIGFDNLMGFWRNWTKNWSISSENRKLEEGLKM